MQQSQIFRRDDIEASIDPDVHLLLARIEQLMVRLASQQNTQVRQQIQKMLCWAVDELSTTAISKSMIQQLAQLLDKYQVEKSEKKDEIVGITLNDWAIQFFMKVMQFTQKVEELTYLRFHKFTENELKLLDKILHSDVLRTYFVCKQIKSYQIEDLIQKCLKYFAEEQFIVFKQEQPRRKHIVGLSLSIGTVMIAYQHLKNFNIGMLYLLHLYFQIPEQQLNVYKINISQTSKKQYYFYSELWPMKFVTEMQSIEAMLATEAIYNDTYTFAQVMGKIQKFVNVYTPTQKLIKNNMVLQQLLSTIESLITDIIALDYQDLVQKYMYYQKVEPKLHKYYTILDYWFAVLQQTLSCLTNHERIMQFKDYNRRFPQEYNFLLGILKNIMNCESAERRMVLESVFFWILEPNSQGSIKESTELWLDIVQTPVYTTKISEQDYELLRQIINSEGIRNFLTQINQTKGKQCQQVQQQIEYEELLEFLRDFPLILFKHSSIDGLSLMNGRVCLNSKTCYSAEDSDIIRANRIITLLHEIFAHQKPKDYVTPQNVLKLSPEGKKPEATLLMETQIFGKPILNLNQEQAAFILNLLNWQLPQVDFRQRFLDIPNTISEENQTEVGRPLFARSRIIIGSPEKKFTKCCVVLK